MDGLGEYWSRRRLLLRFGCWPEPPISDWQTAATAFHVTRSAAITTD
jgi:hypothetical protein